MTADMYISQCVTIDLGARFLCLGTLVRFGMTFARPPSQLMGVLAFLFVFVTLSRLLSCPRKVVPFLWSCSSSVYTSALALICFGTELQNEAYAAKLPA